MKRMTDIDLAGKRVVLDPPPPEPPNSPAAAAFESERHL